MDGLRVTDLGCARGGVPVVRGLSWSMQPGEAVVLRGPNGIGKTTVLRTLAGLQPALSGRIEMAEDAVAYAGHADGLKGGLSVAQNLAFWAAVYGQSSVADAVAAFAMEPLLDRLAQDLSAGQKRRLGLARVLVTGRPIWIFDEPTVSLDRDNTALFSRMVQRHLQGGGLAILATHIDLGLDQARVLDLTPFKAGPEADAADPFLSGSF